MRVEYLWKPQGPVLKKFYQSRARVQVIMGPLGSGKTVTTCQHIFDLMCEQEPNKQRVRPSRWYAVRNTYPDLLETTAKDWLELYGELGKYTEGSKKPPQQELRFTLEDGTRVEADMVFIALDRDQHVKKLRGSQVTGFWMNELKELPRSVFDMADLRHGRFPTTASGGVKCGWHGMIADTNAWDVDHWLHDLLVDGGVPEGWAYFRQPGGVVQKNGHWQVNPDAENIQNLPDDYYHLGMAGKTEDWIRVNLANEYGFVLEGKPVFPEYLDTMHCHDITALPGELTIGIDWGLTPAAVIMQRDPRGRILVLDELVTEDMGAARFAELLVNHLNAKYPRHKYRAWGDPAGEARAQTDERTIFQVVRAKGLMAYPAPTNDWTKRREAVSRSLSRLVDGRPGLIVDTRCTRLRKALSGGYCYRRLQVSGDARYRDQPDKNIHSHVADALQYACMGIGEASNVISGEGRKFAPVKIKQDWHVI